MSLCLLLLLLFSCQVVSGASQVVLVIKRTSANARDRCKETQVQSLDWEDPQEKGMGTPSSILAQRSHGQRSLAGYSP